MDIESNLRIKLKELNSNLIEFENELQRQNNYYQENSNKVKEEQEKPKILLDEMKKTLFQINQTKSELETVITQLAFITSINDKDELTEEEKRHLEELSQVSSPIANDDIPFYKRDYTAEEAEVIRTAFESTLYNDDTPQRK